ncbi:unnamed protein product [Paramecium octaurelia]|uniref:Uncharacterized protein n=1 Tax=Paramecium octaurelia TaxID=43137 RepID=A0A8S1Y4E7_PAROT|nr:unnamed protein product [Paramecium octaurelia]
MYQLYLEDYKGIEEYGFKGDTQNRGEAQSNEELIAHQTADIIGEQVQF